jgi:uncharacterized RDD family membrane protein YckC
MALSTSSTASRSGPASIRLPPIDTVFHASAPEYCEFRYFLAGIFQRALAYAVDHLILGALFLFFVLIGALSGIVVQAELGELAVHLGILAAIALCWLYFVLWEALNNGQTPGKRLMGIRVISERGTPISWSQAILRNFLRLADMFPYYQSVGSVALLPFYGLGFLACFSSAHCQRLGDLAAGTVVVRTEKRHEFQQSSLELATLEPLLAAFPKIDGLTRGQTRALVHYIHRRHTFSAPRREELAQPFVVFLAQRFSLPASSSADQTLQLCYLKIFGADR